MTEQIRTTTVKVPRGEEGEQLRVAVDSDVAVDAHNAWTYREPVAYAVNVWGGFETERCTEVVVGGSASVASEGLAKGVFCDASREGVESRVVIGHDVHSVGTAAWGVSQEARDPQWEHEDGQVSEVRVGGNVEVRSRCDIARGIHSRADKITSCHVQGSVTVVNENRADEEWRRRSRKYPVRDLLDGYKGLAPDSEEYRSGCAFGVQVHNWGETTVDVGGDIRVTSSCDERAGYATGVEVASFDGPTRIVVGGSIVASSDGKDEDLEGCACGVRVWRHDGGDVFVRAEGIVAESADPNTLGIHLDSSSKSDIPARVEVQVLGDVTSSGSGVLLTSMRSSEAAPSHCVLVDGTVRAGINGVCVGRSEEDFFDEGAQGWVSCCKGEPWGNVDVVVWSIVVDRGRMAVQADEGVDHCVSYIVRVEQPPEGVAIRLLSDLEQRTFRGVPHAYRVAHAGDVIRFAVDAGEGWQPAAVYGIQDGKPLSPEPDGTYQVTVPPEGGICLRVVSSPRAMPNA